MELDFLSAFFIGIAGAGHCVAMCGGITTMLTASIADKSKANIPLILAYNFGRIFSYAVAGAIAGFTGSLAAKSLGFPILWLKVIAALFVIFLGLYIAKWSFALAKVENIGKVLWKYLQPLSKKFIPVTNVKQSLFLGMVWGWLPCGLVYSTLTWSIASASWYNGALIMLAFGLGTLPALLTLASGFKFVTQMLRSDQIRKLTAILLIFYGSYSLFIALEQIF
ncbi:sulfite exporter TauE/SafE family protein [Thalassotalea psychrophila]|uniref:Sulfite exporter TauE/SafE family protein n=1 Tax=Thalassotalea psychrophila TaxID=3065647 RepID=A0ABY9U3J3_9GAMM|nr:sulfite exporter TauE/SafE family protein [Colwelliaceae bacterium SQ149]